VGTVGKAAVVTPLYISVAWIMMITYQMFTKTAVSAVLTNFGVVLPAVSEWLFSRMDIIIFIHAFAWVFVLSSVIPSLLLGKERSVLIQFFVCLTLVFISFVVQDIVNVYLDEQSPLLSNFLLLLNNPFLAAAYLSMPYIFMLAIDIKAKRKREKDKKLDKIAEIYMQNSEMQKKKRI
jgi:hypothetical protein